MSCIDEVLSCYVLVGDASGRVSVCTTKDMWSNASQVTSSIGLSECILNVSWWWVALVFTTYDPIT